MTLVDVARQWQRGTELTFTRQAWLDGDPYKLPVHSVTITGGSGRKRRSKATMRWSWGWDPLTEDMAADDYILLGVTVPKEAAP